MSRFLIIVKTSSFVRLFFIPSVSYHPEKAVKNNSLHKYFLCSQIIYTWREQLNKRAFSVPRLTEHSVYFLMYYFIGAQGVYYKIFHQIMIIKLQMNSSFEKPLPSLISALTYQIKSASSPFQVFICFTLYLYKFLAEISFILCILP